MGRSIVLTAVSLVSTLFLVRDMPAQQEIRIEDLKKSLSEPLTTSVLGLLFEDPESVDTINKIWKENVVPRSPFLADLNLEFKTFKAGDNDSLSGYGFAYFLSRDLTRNRLGDTQAGMSFSFLSEGNVAFQRDINPKDFLDSEFSFHLFKSFGGTIRVNSDEYKDKLNELEIGLAGIEDPKALQNSPEMERFISLLSQGLRDQFYVDLSMVGGIESSQDFTTTQYTYGGQLGIKLNLWKHTYLNLFDWPFSVVRTLSGYDQELQPRGGTFPTVLVTLDRVHPSDNDEREMLGVTSDFTRISGEATFRTEVARSSYFEANLRYYREINPPEEIEDSGLGQSTYISAALFAPAGVYVSYSTGRLPLDVVDTKTYELGFRYKF